MASENSVVNLSTTMTETNWGCDIGSSEMFKVNINSIGDISSEKHGGNSVTNDLIENNVQNCIKAIDIMHNRQCSFKSDNESVCNNTASSINSICDENLTNDSVVNNICRTTCQSDCNSSHLVDKENISQGIISEKRENQIDESLNLRNNAIGSQSKFSETLKSDGCESVCTSVLRVIHEEKVVMSSPMLHSTDNTELTNCESLQYESIPVNASLVMNNTVCNSSIKSPKNSHNYVDRLTVSAVESSQASEELRNTSSDAFAAIKSDQIINVEHLNGICSVSATTKAACIFNESLNNNQLNSTCVENKETTENEETTENKSDEAAGNVHNINNIESASLITSSRDVVSLRNKKLVQSTSESSLKFDEIKSRLHSPSFENNLAPEECSTNNLNPGLFISENIKAASKGSKFISLKSSAPENTQTSSVSSDLNTSNQEGNSVPVSELLNSESDNAITFDSKSGFIEVDCLQKSSSKNDDLFGVKSDSSLKDSNSVAQPNDDSNKYVNSQKNKTFSLFDMSASVYQMDFSQQLLVEKDGIPQLKAESMTTDIQLEMKPSNNTELCKSNNSVNQQNDASVSREHHAVRDDKGRLQSDYTSNYQATANSLNVNSISDPTDLSFHNNDVRNDHISTMDILVEPADRFDYGNVGERLVDSSKIDSDMREQKESSVMTSTAQTALSNLDLILQSVAHPSSPYSDSSLRSESLVSVTTTSISAANMPINFFTSNGSMMNQTTVVKRKRGRPKLIRDPPPLGPDGLPVETPVKQKRKYVRKKPCPVVNIDAGSALDLTIASKKPAVATEDSTTIAELQENLVPIPPKRKYTKKAKLYSPEKSSILFDNFVSQSSSLTSGVVGKCSAMIDQILSSVQPPLTTKSIDGEMADNSLSVKSELFGNDSSASICSNDLSDNLKSTSLSSVHLDEAGTPNLMSSGVSIVSAFENLKETILLDGERFYRCPACAYMAKQKGNLRRHLQQHNIFQCSHCSFCTTNNPDLDNHMKEAHPTRWGRRKCSKCSKFVRPEDQEDHLTTCTGEKSEWPCDQCSKVFHFEGALKVHMKIHNEEQPAKLMCGCCGKQYKYEAAMRSHLLTHGAESLVGMCMRCGKKCANDSELQEHIRNHQAANVALKNDGVGLSSVAKMVSNEKLETSSEEKDLTHPDPFEESDAQTKPAAVPVFESVNRVLQPNEKPKTKFSCVECSYETQFKCNLAKHIATQHSEKGEKSIKCPLCEKLFSTECGMQKHLKILHSEERAFVCQVCSKAFKTPNSLTLHSEVHNSNETYACNIDGCTKTFRAKRMLTNHKKLEHGILIKRFDCRQPGCSQVFVKESHLRKHLATSHSGN